MKKACKGPPWNESLHVGTSGNISAPAQEYSLEGMGKTVLFKSQDKHTAICQGGAKSISEALGLERNIGEYWDVLFGSLFQCIDRSQNMFLYFLFAHSVQ